MRTPTALEQKLLTLGEYATALRVSIADSTGTLVPFDTLDGKDWIVAADITSSIDQKISTASVTLRRDDFLVSLAPLMTSSKLNATAAAVWQGRALTIDVMLLPVDSRDTSVGSWTSVFSGSIDSVDWASSSVKITARDLAAQIQDTFIEGDRVYGIATKLSGAVSAGATSIDTATSIPVGRDVVLEPGKVDDTGASLQDGPFQVTAVSGSGPYTLTLSAALAKSHVDGATVEDRRPVEQVMQQILNDVGLSSVTLAVPVSPGWMIGPYKQNSEPAWSALQKLASQIGWSLRYKWSGTAWQLTFYEPDRSVSSPAASITDDQYTAVTALKTDRQDIRNVVRVYYGVKAYKNSDGVSTPTNNYVEVSDTASIAAYGRRWMQLTPGASNLISNATDATTLANAALSDLAEPSEELEVDLIPYPWVELGDYLLFKANGVHFDNDQSLAVTSVKHSFQTTGGKTTIHLRGKPAAQKHGWLVRDGRPGVAPGGHIPAAPTGLTLQTGVDHQGSIAFSFVRASWTPPAEVSVRNYEVQYRITGKPDWTSAFVTENILRLSPLPGGVQYDVRVRVTSGTGVSGSWSSIATITTANSGAPAKPAHLLGQFVGADALFTWDANTEPDLDHYKVEVLIGVTVVRTEIVKGTSFRYTFTMNEEDNSPPSPSVNIIVYAVNTAGISSPPSTSVGATNAIPPQPTGLTLSSSVSQITVSVPDTAPTDFAYLEAQVGTRADYSDAVTEAKSASLTGVKVAVAAEAISGSLTAAVSAGATTLSSSVSVPVGSTLAIGPGTVDASGSPIDETRTVTAVSGVGPYTLTLGTALTYAHDSGAPLKAEPPNYVRARFVDVFAQAGPWVTASQNTQLITRTEVGPAAISTPELAANSIDASKITAGAIVAGKIAANAVDASNIKAGSIDLSKLAADTAVTYYRATAKGNSASGTGGLYDASGTLLASVGRSYTLATYDATTGAWSKIGTYDVFAADDNARSLAAAIAKLAAGTIIALITDDDPQARRLTTAVNMLTDAQAYALTGAASSSFYLSTITQVSVNRGPEGGAQRVWNVATDFSAYAVSGIMLRNGANQPSASSIVNAGAYVKAPAGTTMTLGLRKYSANAGYVATAVTADGSWQWVAVENADGSVDTGFGIQVYASATVGAPSITFQVALPVVNAYLPVAMPVTGLPGQIERCGGTRSVFESDAFAYRSAYALIGVVGAGPGAGIERYAGSADSDPNAIVNVEFGMRGGKLMLGGLGTNAVGTARLDAGGLAVTDPQRVEKVKLGKITGKAGVPSGVDYGLWGTLGTGVFIQGALKLVAAGTATINPATQNIGAGGNYTFSGQSTILSNVTVPDGKKWLLITIPKSLAANLFGVLTLEGFWTAGLDGSTDKFSLPPGTYASVGVQAVIHARGLGSYSNISPQLIISYLFVEVDL